MMTMPAAVVALDVPSESGASYREPFHTRMGESNWRRLGNVFGLAQFGVNLETYLPGAQSALRHWHTLSDEFVYVLEGEMVLRTDAGDTVMRPGMCVGFKAGARNAHHLVNRSEQPGRLLIIGTRVPGDQCFYPDDDLLWVDTEQGQHAAHKDGRRYA
jgi:uncharacterized cupin superfamily protein